MSQKKTNASYQALLLNTSYNSLPEPQGWADIPVGAHPFFFEALRSRPAHEWSLIDLQSAQILSVLSYKLNQAIEQLGDNLLVEDDKGNQRPSPLIKIVQDLTALRLSAASKLGFNTNARRNTIVGATHGTVTKDVEVRTSPEPVGDFQARLAKRIKENKQ